VSEIEVGSLCGRQETNLEHWTVGSCPQTDMKLQIGCIRRLPLDIWQLKYTPCYHHPNRSVCGASSSVHPQLRPNRHGAMVIVKCFAFGSCLETKSSALGEIAMLFAQVSILTPGLIHLRPSPVNLAEIHKWRLHSIPTRLCFRTGRILRRQRILQSNLEIHVFLHIPVKGSAYAVQLILNLSLL
jgi:hypothetical protein